MKKEDDSKAHEIAFVERLLKNLTPEERKKLLKEVMASQDYDLDDDDFIDEPYMTIEDWRRTHPDNLNCGSDQYYTDLAKRIIDGPEEFRLPLDLPDGFLYHLGITAAAYLEDLVSEVGVWSAIRNLFRKKLGRTLPFYDCDHQDYFDEEPNLEDCRLMVWIVVSRLGQYDGRFFSPFSELTEKLGHYLFDILSNEYESAPATQRLADYVNNIMSKGDFMHMRELFKWLAYHNPLTASPYLLDWIDNQISHTDFTDSVVEPDKLAYQLICSNMFIPSGPLGVLPSEYLAEMARAKGLDKLADNLDTVRFISLRQFTIVDHDRKHLVFEDASGSKYLIEQASIFPQNFKKGKIIYNMFAGSIARFGDKWHMIGSGVFADSIPDIKTNMYTEPSGSYLKITEQIVVSNRGRRLYYCKDLDELSKLLGEPVSTDDPEGEEAKELVVYFDKENGLSIIPYAAACFKDPKNPMYDKSIAKNYSLHVIMSGTIPESLAVLIQEKRLMPEATIYASQGKRFGKAVLQQNIRFIIDFYRSFNPEPEDSDD